MVTWQTLSHESINLLGVELSKLYYLFFFIGLVSVLDGILSKEKPVWRLGVCVLFFGFTLKDALVT